MHALIRNTDNRIVSISPEPAVFDGLYWNVAGERFIELATGAHARAVKATDVMIGDFITPDGTVTRAAPAVPLPVSGADKIRAMLYQIDLKSEAVFSAMGTSRAKREIAIGKTTYFTSKLQALETEAETLRAELSTL